MRNIALLEWGPASLYYIQPRERIKIRTEWLEGGPQLPPFLSSMEDAKANDDEISVRYALSAFEDLNSAIRNLRRCFGFPYQEYIGYLNTLTRTHRARREHEGLLPGLRRWAIFGNVDAVVWIDYSKANQPPGSFKMGPRDSRPFSANHIEICTHVVTGNGGAEVEGDESEVAWSELGDDEQAGGVQGGGHSGGGTGGDMGGSGQLKWTIENPLNDSSRRPSKMEGRFVGALGGLRAPLRKVRSARGSQEYSPRTSPRPKDEARRQNNPPLQEEFIPAHGSIYQRSVAPGPGYYGRGAALAPAEVGPSFGRRQKSVLESLSACSQDAPGPGDYRPKTPMAEAKGQLACFNRAERMVSPVDAAKKLPFISHLASACEGFGAITPNAFNSVHPEASHHSHSRHGQAPKYSFGKLRRPF